MHSIPEIGWTTTGLLLVRVPGMGYDTMTLSEYRKCGRFQVCVTVVGIIPEQHRDVFLEHLPQERDEVSLAVLFR